jgi:hypothetical protein
MGVTIEFDHPATGRRKKSFNLMLASNELTDHHLLWRKQFLRRHRKLSGQRRNRKADDHLGELVARSGQYLSERPEIDKMVKTDAATTTCTLSEQAARRRLQRGVRRAGVRCGGLTGSRNSTTKCRKH